MGSQRAPILLDAVELVIDVLAGRILVAARTVDLSGGLLARATSTE
jgi:hypothetical protein